MKTELELKAYLQAILDEGVSIEKLEEVYQAGVKDGEKDAQETFILMETAKYYLEKAYKEQSNEKR